MPDDFETRLRGIPWDTLYHSYGTAADVPDLLLDLRSPRSSVCSTSQTVFDCTLKC